MLRRRRRADGDSQGPSDAGQDAQAIGQSTGPWDVTDDYPQVERIDCGSLLIPIREGFDVQVQTNSAEEEGQWVAVIRADSGMQLQAFAAPRSDGLWDEVRQEIAANIAESGGSSAELQGPLGIELSAQVPVDEDGKPGQELHPIRFLGCDGSRWFLRGVITGPAATDGGLRPPFDEMFADIVVVRGDYPAPQRQQLEIRLPEEVQRALEEQLAQDAGGWGLTDPFARGPEITETR